MRARTMTAVLFLVTLVPNVGNAQVYAFATPPPQVTASTARWQLQSVPIEFEGIVYQPTAFVRPFDRNVMTQVGLFDGVPLYADATLEPFSVVFVPVARGMRQYERERVGALAGTTGSRTPAAPVQPQSTIGAPEATVGVATPAVAGTAGMTIAAARTLPPSARTLPPSHAAAAATPTGRAAVETAVSPGAGNGVWIRYDATTWYSNGEAVPFTPERFTRIGSYRQFPVYRERRGDNARVIWVAVVQDGPVAPYAKR